MTIDVDGIVVSNDEVVMRDSEAVGYVSSSGYAHHVGKSMAYVGKEHAEP
jgi:dimethylglycine dehydrogenase